MVVLALLSATATRAVFAEGAAQRYEALFGKAEKDAATTATPRDDAALANKLADAAKDLSDDPELLTLMREKTVALGEKDPSGMAAAIAAAEALLESDAKAHESYRPRLLELSRCYYQKAPRPEKRAAGTKYLERLLDEANSLAAAGKLGEAEPLYRQALPICNAIGSPRKEEVQATLKSLAARAAARQRIKAQAARLKKEPDNKTLARDLTIASVVEADDLAAAAPFALASGDEALQEHIQLALSDPDTLQEADWIRLGDWYKSLAGDAASVAKPRLLARAADFFRRFLDAHETADGERLRVSIAMEAVEKELHKLGGGSRPVELLSRVKVGKDTRGTWTKRDGALVCSLAPSALIFPVSVDGNYRLRLVFKREVGEGFMHLSLPVHKNRVTLLLSYEQEAIAGLWLIDRKGARENGTGRSGKLKNNKDYVLDIEVTVNYAGNAKITATLDGRPYVSFDGAASRLSPLPIVALKGNNILIDSRLAKWHFKSVMLRMTSGEVKPLVEEMK